MGHAPWILYGANGFTGRLCAAEARRRGLRPVLAGRRPEAVAEVAHRHGFEYEIFDFEDLAFARRKLCRASALLNCAGPFVETCEPAIQACIQTRTHYLDVTGEIPVFEAARARGEQARQAAIALMPGVAFDIVPSDCLAKTLAEALPSAESLEIGFYMGGNYSGGTVKTMLEIFPTGGKVRRGGRLYRVRIAEQSKRIPFVDAERPAVSVPWGDVSTAFDSTQIPDITVYWAPPPWMMPALRFTELAVHVLRNERLRRSAQWLAGRVLDGPSEQVRRAEAHQFWGQVTAGGQSVSATLTTPEAYQLSASVAVDATERVSQGQAGTGFVTPSVAFGADYVTHFDGCELRLHDSRQGRRSKAPPANGASAAAGHM